MEFHVADKEGTWFLSSARYGFTDPESGARFEPGVPTKAKATEWTKAQAAWLAETADPLAPPPKEPAAKKA